MALQLEALEDRTLPTVAASPGLAVGLAPFAVVSADVNGDGIADLITANTDSNQVSVLLGNRDGSFQAARHFAVGIGPVAVAVGDVNADGRPDVITANSFSNDVSVLLGNGDGSFQDAQSFAVGSGPVALAVADVNNDGLLDLVVANALSSDVTVLQGHGDGTFCDPQTFAVGNVPESVVVDDVNGDGILDIVTTNAGTNDLSILLGNGDGSFQEAFVSDFGTVSGGVNDLYYYNDLADLIATQAGSNDFSILFPDPPSLLSGFDLPTVPSSSPVDSTPVADVIGFEPSGGPTIAVPGDATLSTPGTPSIIGVIGNPSSGAGPIALVVDFSNPNTPDPGVLTSHPNSSLPGLVPDGRPGFAAPTPEGARAPGDLLNSPEVRDDRAEGSPLDPENPTPVVLTPDLKADLLSVGGPFALAAVVLTDLSGEATLISRSAGEVEIFAPQLPGSTTLPGQTQNLGDREVLLPFGERLLREQGGRPQADTDQEERLSPDQFSGGALDALERLSKEAANDEDVPTPGNWVEWLRRHPEKLTWNTGPTGEPAADAHPVPVAGAVAVVALAAGYSVSDRRDRRQAKVAQPQLSGKLSGG